MESRRRSFFLSLPFLVWFAGFLLAPLCLILATSFTRRSELGVLEPTFDTSAYSQLLNPLYAHVLERTIVLAGFNTLITILIAYPVAFLVSRLSPRARNWAVTLILIPFWTNFLVRILAFMDVLRLHPFGTDWLYTPKGVLAALVYNYLPFAILPLLSAMANVPNSVLEAARDLGASRRQVLGNVLWPLTREGVGAAALIVFIPSLGEFLIPDLVGGGRFFVLGTFLQNQFLSARNWPLGAAAIVLLAMLTALCLLAAASGLKWHQEKRAAENGAGE